MLQSHFDISMLSFFWTYCEKNVLLICNRTLHLALDGTWHWDFYINQKKKKQQKKYIFSFFIAIHINVVIMNHFLSIMMWQLRSGRYQILESPKGFIIDRLLPNWNYHLRLFKEWLLVSYIYIILANIQFNIWMYISIPACAQIICHLNLLD